MSMLSVGSVAGHTAVTFENDRLKVVVLPGKGADIYSLVHKPSGVDALMKTPWGLKPPSGSPPADFLENYEGAWQELFPSANDACEVEGHSVPFHGEVALRAWSGRSSVTLRMHASSPSGWRPARCRSVLSGAWAWKPARRD